jgi:hypothetical protein
MQRRAAAVYAAFFTLVAIGAWSLGEFGLVADRTGLLWITVLSGLTVVLLVSLSYLPTRA